MVFLLDLSYVVIWYYCWTCNVIFVGLVTLVDMLLVDYCLLKIGEMLLKCCQNFIEFINFDKCMSNFLKTLF
jgi:hypothetical protein